MRSHAALAVLAGAMLFPTLTRSQDGCDELVFSDQQVKEAVDRERSMRSDLPAPFSDYRWEVTQSGCQYIYAEYSLPETPEQSRFFRINRNGVIVDIQPSDGSFQCPGENLTETELAEVVRMAREECPEMPRPYPSYRTRVDRMGCLYLYFEYALPDVRGKYKVFTIDSFGELLEFSVSQPY